LNDASHRVVLSRNGFWRLSKKKAVERLSQIASTQAEYSAF
jgi:hypothetical protein